MEQSVLSCILGLHLLGNRQRARGGLEAQLACFARLQIISPVHLFGRADSPRMNRTHTSTIASGPDSPLGTFDGNRTLEFRLIGLTQSAIAVGELRRAGQ
jgi:hypothetical protein